MDRFLVFGRKSNGEWMLRSSLDTALTGAMRVADQAISQHVGFERACVMEILGQDAVPLFKFRYLAAGDTVR
jgi:hypothetical protein